MKRLATPLLALFCLTAQADEGAWQKSYVLEAAGKYADAEGVLNALANGPDADFALMRSGWLAYRDGSYNEAVTHYQRALERNPKSLEARNGITLPLLAQQRWREAAMYARQTIAESAWDYTAHVRLLVAEEGLRDWRGMAEHAKHLAERYPADATAWVYLARAQAWLGNVREAGNAYRRVLARYPGQAEAAAYLAKNGAG